MRVACCDRAVWDERYGETAHVLAPLVSSGSCVRWLGNRASRLFALLSQYGESAGVVMTAYPSLDQVRARQIDATRCHLL